MILALIAPALACGGLFVAASGTGAAVTADLRTAYLVGESTTTMISQVAWTGDAAAFALLVPIPGLVVEDNVAAVDAATLTELIDRTDPTFYGTSSCSMGLGVYGCAADGTFADTASVQVLGDYTAGPYDVQLLDAAEDGAITNWLQDNGYAVPDAALPALSDYAAQGYYFLAVQLRDVTATTDVTALPAIAVTYEGTDVVYPMRLSASSTAEEMEVMVLIASAHRMEPKDDPWVVPDLGGGQPLGDALQAWYNGRFRQALEEEGRRAWGLEYAGVIESTLPLFVSVEANGLTGPLATDGQTFVTRYRTFLRPSQMNGDITFVRADADDAYAVSGTTFASVPMFALFGTLWARRRSRSKG